MGVWGKRVTLMGYTMFGEVGNIVVGFLLNPWATGSPFSGRPVSAELPIGTNFHGYLFLLHDS